MEERNRLGSLLLSLAGAMLIIRGGSALLHLLVTQFQESDNAYLLDRPYWQWVVLAGLGVGLILGSSRLGKLPNTNAGSLDLSMPAMGLMLLLGTGAIFKGITQLPESGLLYSMALAYNTAGIAAVFLGLTFLGYAPSISRSCQSVSIADLYASGLRFTAASTGLWSLASLATHAADQLFSTPLSYGSRLDQQTLLFSSYSVNVLSGLLIIAVMVRMSIVGWRWVSEDQPEGDFIAPIVSYSALAAGLSLNWAVHHPVSLIVLTTLGLLIGTSPRLIANLIRKLLARTRTRPGPGPGPEPAA